jgi:hypothetical protein
MKRSAIVAAALVLGCNTNPPELLPPPFGPSGPQPTRFFFPAGLAKAGGGVLLVANGNFNRAFAAGTVVAVKRKALDDLLSTSLDCDVANPDPACTAPIDPTKFFDDAVMIGNYAGPLVLNTDKTAAYTGSRDSGKISAVSVTVGTDGVAVLGCPPNAGDNARKDCRAGIIDLRSVGVDGPYAIAAGNANLPGKPAESVLFVSSVIPHIDAISSGSIITSTWVAALRMQDPSKLLFTMLAGSLFIDGGYGVGPMVFDDMRRQLYLSGCYQRSTSFGAGEPGSGLCFGVSTNFLRILNVDAGGAAVPYLLDLRADVLSTFTTQLLLDVPDPPAIPSTPPTTLWATMRNPDSLVVIELPTQPSVLPRVREVKPLPIAPSDMVRIDRGAAPPLLAIVTERLGAVSIFDTGTDEVVAQVGRLGDSPFNIQQIDCPTTKPASACLAVSVFGSCRIALIEVPRSTPSKTVLRALAGSCP